MLVNDWKNVSTAMWKKFPTDILMKMIKVIHTFDEYNNKIWIPFIWRIYGRLTSKWFNEWDGYRCYY